MFIITCKYQTLSGRVISKTLCGRGMNTEFIVDRDAKGIKTWKTREGAYRFIKDRPGFVECRARMGGRVMIEEVLT
jgi:hypothetical protein